MRNLNIMWIILAAFLAAAACSEDDPADEGGGGNDGTGAGGEDTGTGEEDTGTGVEDTGPVEAILHFTFDEDDEGWTAEEGGWTYNAADGAWDGVLEYTTTDESSFVQALWSNGIDLSEALEIEVKLRLNEAVTGGFQVFIKTGPDWDWYDNWFNLPAHNEYDTYSFNMQAAHGQPSANDTLVDIADVRAIGVSMSSGSDAAEPGTMSVSIDEVIVK